MGHIKSKLDKVRKALLEGMPTRAEMDKPCQANVQKHRAWSRENAENIREWKALCRADGISANLEDIRPE